MTIAAQAMMIVSISFGYTNLVCESAFILFFSWNSTHRDELEREFRQKNGQLRPSHASPHAISFDCPAD